MSESTTGAEFLLGIEEYLRYINQDRQADSIHTLSRTFASEDVLRNTIRSFMQDLSSILQDNFKDLADLLHGVVKSNDSNRVLLQYLGKQINQQDLKDLIYASIKSNNNQTIYKNLLQYLGKQVNDQDLKDLIYAIIKSETNELALKALCQYISKKIENKFTKDLIHGITRSDDPSKSVCQYCSNNIENKDVKDLIHGFIKSENDLVKYKALLNYVGQNIENQSLSDLSKAISRSIDSKDFENDFIKYYLAMLDRRYSSDKLFRGINNLIKSDVKRTIINDIFSRGQIRSKIWLIEELMKIETKYDNVLVLAGWFGQFKSIYEKKCTYSKMRIVEIDKHACETSDYIFNLSNLENHKVKSVLADINNLTLYKNGYEWSVSNFKDKNVYQEKFSPNLIINTSAEHMTEEWFHQIRFKELETDPIIAIQSNNLFDIPEHVNCVYSIDHMKKKFPLSRILYEGELQLKGYKRVMLIGRI